MTLKVPGVRSAVGLGDIAEVVFAPIDRLRAKVAPERQCKCKQRKALWNQKLQLLPRRERWTAVRECGKATMYESNYGPIQIREKNKRLPIRFYRFAPRMRALADKKMDAICAADA